jgi:NADPH:quinone reductase-like Zn-dependent oxidoreductase
VRAAILDPAPDATPLRVGDWPDPGLPPGWVIVRVERAALNHNDALWVDERHLLPGPSVIGSDAAGTVVAVADDVTTVEVGSDVLVLPSLWWGAADDAPGPDFQLLGHPTQGTHAELLAVPAENVYRRPGRLGVEEAAALPVAGLTAWRAVVTRGGLIAGQTVVVTAASAGVGTFAVQIAAAIGARVVAVTSTPAKLETAVRLGASAGVLRTSSRFAEDLEDAVGPDGADLVVDSAGASWAGLLGVLRRGGRLVNLGRTASSTAGVDLPTLFWRHLSVLGSSMGSPRDFAALLAHVESSTWVPVVDEVVPLDEVATAYARLGDPERVGKVVLDLS